MCKHVAAVLYGIGARFDHQPELLFRLRGVDEKDLIVKAGRAIPLARQEPAKGRVLEGQDLSDIFGLEMANDVSPGADLAEPQAANKPKRAGKAPVKVVKPTGRSKPKKVISKRPRKQPV